MRRYGNPFVLMCKITVWPQLRGRRGGRRVDVEGSTRKKLGEGGELCIHGVEAKKVGKPGELGVFHRDTRVGGGERVGADEKQFGQPLMITRTTGKGISTQLEGEKGPGFGQGEKRD